MLLEAWRAAERALPAGVGDVRAVEEMMPRKIKKKRMLTADDGAELGWEECVAHARARARARYGFVIFALVLARRARARQSPAARAGPSDHRERGSRARWRDAVAVCAPVATAALSRFADADMSHGVAHCYPNRGIVVVVVSRCSLVTTSFARLVLALARKQTVHAFVLREYKSATCFSSGTTTTNSLTSRRHRRTSRSSRLVS